MKKKFKTYLSVSIALFIVGILLGIGEKSGLFSTFNTAVVKWASSHRSVLWNPYFIGISKWTDTVHDVTYALVVIVALSLIKRWKEPLALFLSTLFAGISIEVLKLGLRVQRPHFSWLVNAKSYSYPSGHSVGSIAIYGMFVYMLLKSSLPRSLAYALSGIITAFIISILYDRWYVGVHWGMDVIGGALIGFACLFLAIGIVEKMGESKEE